MPTLVPVESQWRAPNSLITDDILCVTTQGYSRAGEFNDRDINIELLQQPPTYSPDLPETRSLLALIKIISQSCYPNKPS